MLRNKYHISILGQGLQALGNRGGSSQSGISSLSHRIVRKEHNDIGSEKRIVHGVNIPDNPKQLINETKQAAGGLAESITSSITYLTTAARRAMGILTSEEKPTSEDIIHGGSGVMESPQYHHPGDRNTIDSKYKELHDREKPNFPHGERSINDMFPSMKEAAALQNQQQETEENPKGILEDSLHEKGP